MLEEELWNHHTVGLWKEILERNIGIVLLM